jgi:hypothetical protein
MQITTQSRRFNLGRSFGLFIGLGLVASLVLIAAMLMADRSSTSPGRDNAVVEPGVISAERAAFLEQNLNLPSAAVSESAPSVDQKQLFLEENLPAISVPVEPPMSVDRARFLEMNLNLPSAGARPMSIQQTRFMEINLLPGDEGTVPQSSRYSHPDRGYTP